METKNETMERANENKIPDSSCNFPSSALIYHRNFLKKGKLLYLKNAPKNPESCF